MLGKKSAPVAFPNIIVLLKLLLMDRLVLFINGVGGSVFWARAFVLGCLVWLCQLAMAAPAIDFMRLKVEHGLTQNSVLSIAQDSRGYIWLGTRHGLNRFDGYRVTNYYHQAADSQSLSNDYINSLCLDGKNRLWIGTEKGLNWYNDSLNHFERVTLPTDPGQSQPVILCIYQTRSYGLWVGTSRGVFLQPPGREGFVAIPLARGPVETLRQKSIRRFFEDRHGKIWVATTQGLFALWQQPSALFDGKLYLAEPGNTQALADPYVTCIAADNTNRLWVGTMGGLHYLNTDLETFTRVPAGERGPLNNNIRTILPDNTGQLWIGTQEGLSIYQTNQGAFENYQYNPANPRSLSQNSVHAIFEDQVGSIWVGTFYGGANVHHRLGTPFKVFQPADTAGSLSNQVISSFATDKQGHIWVATEGGGLNRYHPGTARFTVYKHQPGKPGSLSSNLVKKLFVDASGNLWVGTHGGGLNVYLPASNQFATLLYEPQNPLRKNDEIVALTEDSLGHFWVGRHPGLQLYRPPGTQLEALPLPAALQSIQHKHISALLLDSHKNLWIGTLDGLYLWNPQLNQLQNLMPDKATDTWPINCIQQDSRGQVWVGVFNKGLWQYDNKYQPAKRYTQAQGLPHANVWGVLEDDAQHLWVSTSNGLARLNPNTGAVEQYTSTDGLMGNEFNYNAYYKAPDGSLLFGGTAGYIQFTPSQVTHNKKPAPLVFTSLKILNQTTATGEGILQEPLGYQQKITLPHLHNTFTVEFALLNFIRPSKNKYAYKLEPVHQQWLALSNPMASFTNLAPGKYTLWIKGANNDGVWSNPVALQIELLPPFWKTPWAYLLYALAGSGLLFFMVRFFYLRALLRRDKEMHELKLNFFTNISHEIRTHLTLIMAPIEKMLVENQQHTVLAHQLNNARQNASRLLKLVNELMDFRKAETNHLTLYPAPTDIIAFITPIYNAFEEMALAKNITLSLKHADALPPVLMDKEQMEKVIFNLLTNAFKYTPQSGTIEVYIHQPTSSTISIAVTDNGIGIAEKYLPNLFTNYFQVNEQQGTNTGYGIGLALSKQIVEQHQGTLTVQSRVATATQQGFTKFLVTLPVATQLNLFATAPPQPGVHASPPPYSAAPEGPVPPPQTPPPLLNECQVLVVEDNDAMRQLITQALQPYTLVQADNGQRGWELATTQIPDVIVSDVMMPAMDGFTLCHHLKTDPRTSHIPVVLLTAKTAQTETVKGLSTGADVYLTKPFSAQVLQLTVRNLLAARQVMREKYSQEFILGPRKYSLSNVDEHFLSQLIEVVEDNMENPDFGVELMARKMAMSQSVLYKKVKALTNLSVNDFAKQIRLKKAAQWLAQKQWSVFEVSVLTGFADRKYFSREFKKLFGVNPSDYTSQQATADSPQQ